MNRKWEIRSERYANYISFLNVSFLEPRPKPHIDRIGHASDSNLLPDFQNADSSSTAMKTSLEGTRGGSLRERKQKRTLAISGALNICQAVYICGFI